jgi:hypothetical protein
MSDILLSLILFGLALINANLYRIGDALIEISKRG